MTTIPLSIILMVHNEEKTIASEVKNYYEKIVKKMPKSELIIAEDGSNDKTREILYKLAKKLPIVLLATPEKRGYMKSLRLAIEKSQGNIIFYADAGGKHDPSDFWILYEKITSFDFVSGYKKIRHDPLYRLVLAWGLNTIINRYFSVQFNDIDCGFKLFTRKVKKKLLSVNWILKNNISMEISLRIVRSGFSYF